MEMVLNVLGCIGFGLWVFFNTLVAITHSKEQMLESFVYEQHMVGKILAFIYFIPAWLLKGFKTAVNKVIK